MIPLLLAGCLVLGIINTLILVVLLIEVTGLAEKLLTKYGKSDPTRR